MTNEKSIPLILIADDDPDDQMMIRDAFEERCKQCQVCFVSNGVELMAALKRGKNEVWPDGCPIPDLVLLDLNMPLKDGRQALVEIRSTPGLKELPTVILTTSRNDDDISFCSAHGADDYIVKPTRYTELLNIVESLKDYWDHDNRETTTPDSANHD